MNSAPQNPALRRSDVRRRFDRAATTFDGADFVHATTREGLLDRLGPMRVEVNTVLDVGCGTGSARRLLSKQFRGARIIGVDLSHGMLRQAREKRSWFSRSPAIQADATALPFVDHVVDVVFANLLLPWVDDPAAFFREANRVLRRDGLLLFSTLGPDSLLELRRAWQVADEHEHVNLFLDMHDIGDAAVRSGLRDPVLDVDRLTVTYEKAAALFRDLTAVGGRNSLSDRRRTLTGRRRFAAMTEALDASRIDGQIALDLELVYGHCWGSGVAGPGGEFRVDPSQIGRRR